METKISPLDILIDRGFTPVCDLNYCLANGTEFYVGIHQKSAAIVALMHNKYLYFIDKEGLKIMAETAKTYGIEKVFLYTNYGIELHSKYEKPELIGLNKIIKIDETGFDYE